MTQKQLNLWGGLEPEEFERFRDIEQNFTELFPADKNYASELLAAKGGVTKGQLYHNAGSVLVRYQDIPVPAVGSMGIQGYAPAITHFMTRAPAVQNLSFTGIAPVVTQQLARAPASGSLSLVGAAPVLT